MLGISRGSVREALRRLAGDGLVEFEVNRGFFVADLGLDRVLERLEARLQLEPAIARLAAERRSDDDLAALRRAVADERAAARPRRPTTPAAPFTRRSSVATRNRRARPDLRLALDRRRRPTPAGAAPRTARLAGGRRRGARGAARRGRGTARATAPSASCERTSRARGATGRAGRRADAVSRVRLVHVLSENWTLTPPRDLRALVRMAREAEDAGFDAVMVSEHVVLGRGADAEGVTENPRDYALPGNQDPAMPWPSSLVLLVAIAAATTTLRLAASRDHRAAPPPAAPREGSRDPRPALRRPARRPARPSAGTEPEYARSACPSRSAARCSTSTWRPGSGSGAIRRRRSRAATTASDDVWVEPKP